MGTISKVIRSWFTHVYAGKGWEQQRQGICWRNTVQRRQHTHLHSLQLLRELIVIGHHGLQLLDAKGDVGSAVIAAVPAAA